MVKGAQIVRADGGSIVDQAIAWHIRLTDAQDGEWTDFIAWLEADPAHASAYDKIEMQDRLISTARFPEPVAVPVIANDNIRPGWWWIAGGTVAAAALVTALIPSLISSRASPYEVATRPGQHQNIALGDGTTVEVSGGTLLRLDRLDPRTAALERGEATFDVRHDNAHPFAIAVGTLTIRDLGTVFNVSREGGRVSVAVSRGSVVFQPGREALVLKAGEMLTADERTGHVSQGRISPDAVGGWRKGTLIFDGQSLEQVAAKLNRLYAANLTIEGSLSAQPFTGMVRFTGAADRDVPHLAALIGAKWRRDRNRWILSSGTSAPR